MVSVSNKLPKKAYKILDETYLAAWKVVENWVKKHFGFMNKYSFLMKQQATNLKTEWKTTADNKNK